VLGVFGGGGEAQVWALVNTDSSVEARKFRMVNTGESLIDVEQNCLIPIGTILYDRGDYVSHLFEIK